MLRELSNPMRFPRRVDAPCKEKKQWRFNDIGVGASMSQEESRDKEIVVLKVEGSMLGVWDRCGASGKEDTLETRVA